MAIFIPAKVGASAARSIHIKRALAKLDDGYVVRTPLRPGGWAPDFFVQHAAAGWLAIAVSDAPYDALADGQLFDGGDRAGFDALLDDMAALPVPGRLLVMWACSDDEVRHAAHAGARAGIQMVSKSAFLGMATTLVPRLAAPVDTAVEYALMARYFAEAEIDAVCTTRRLFVRDNAATLQRYFLDVQQEWAAKLDLALPHEQAGIAGDMAVRLVNGVAGSGKTLIALSRAMLLAEMYPDQRVLVLIHNAPVVADLRAKLHRTRGALPRNLEISTFSAWVHRQWRNLYRRPPRMPESPRDVEEWIAQCRHAYPDLRLPVHRLREELDFINESMITTAEQYFRASRAGRGFALRPNERAAVWDLFCAVTASLQAQGMTLWSALPLDICLVDQRPGLEKYHHVLMDEAQFCAPSWFQTVRAAMHPGSSLFLCADPNQGFMKSRLSWKSVGLDVAGRTKKLRKSYRTTHAILASATAVLARNTQGGQGDPEDFLVPDLAGMEPGAPPVLVYAASPQDAVDRLVNEVRASLETGALALADVLVMYGDRASKGLLYDRLCAAFGSGHVWWFNVAGQRRLPPGGYRRGHVRLANLDTATGLEAGVVLMIGVENLLAASSHPGPEQEAQARKLYMAMTRAGARLVVIASEPVPPAIADAFMLAPDSDSRLSG